MQDFPKMVKKLGAEQWLTSTYSASKTARLERAFRYCNTTIDGCARVNVTEPYVTLHRGS